MVHAASVVRDAAAMQSGAVVGGQLGSRRGVLGIGRWSPSRLFDGGWKSDLRLRQRRPLQDGERSAGTRRLVRWTWTGDRGRNGVRQLRLRARRRHSRQRAAGVVGRRKVIRGWKGRRGRI